MFGCYFLCEVPPRMHACKRPGQAFQPFSSQHRIC